MAMSTSVRVVLLAAMAALLLAWCGREQGPRTRVVLITLDTLRYDRFAGPGGLEHMPETRAFAERGLDFENHYATTSCTQPTHASLLTGLYPWEHGVTRNGVVLAKRHRTLAEELDSRGFRTHAVVASFPGARHVRLRSGLRFLPRRLHSRSEAAFPRPAGAGDARQRAGFGQEGRHADVGEPTGRGGQLLLPGEVGHRQGAGGDRRGRRGRKQFFWFHYFDPHDPYGGLGRTSRFELQRAVAPGRGAQVRPSGSPSCWKRRAGYYDQDVRDMDRELGRLFEPAARGRGPLPDARAADRRPRRELRASAAPSATACA